MWSWYYGGQEPTRNKIVFPGGKKQRQRSNSISSIDLTEALDPEWYFRQFVVQRSYVDNYVITKYKYRDRTDPDPKGILKSPGKIKQVDNSTLN